MKRIGEKLYSIWLSILRVLHLYPDREHDKVCTTIRMLYEEQIAGMNQTIQNRDSTIKLQADKLDEKQRKIEELKEEIFNLTNDHNNDATVIHELQDANRDIKEECDRIKRERDAILEKIDTYKETASVNLDYVKDVQKQLGRVFESSQAFGFPGSMPIPGSTSIRDWKYIDPDDGTGYSIIRSRIMALDEITQEINKNPDMMTRISLILQQLKRYGGMEKFAERLIYSGAVSMILGYNTDTTTYELYLETVAKQVSKDAMLQLNMNKPKEETTDGRYEEESDAVSTDERPE